MWPSVMVTVVIPSRLHSSRFPGKALIPLRGVPLITRVAQQVVRSGVAGRVIVATDDEGIAAAVVGAGVEVHLEQGPFASGTDRVAAAIQALAEDSEVIINVQGDEPLVDEGVLRAALAALQGNDIGTVASRPAPGQDLTDPDTVKVLVGADGRARCFDRRLPPDARGPLVHVGIYAFGRRALARFAGLPVCAAERRHRLEQLRALEAGMSIGVARVEGALRSVNRPGDVSRVEQILDQTQTAGGRFAAAVDS